MWGRKLGIVQPVLHFGSQNGHGSRHIAFGSFVASEAAALALGVGLADGLVEGLVEGLGELLTLLLGALLLGEKLTTTPSYEQWTGGPGGSPAHLRSNGF